jgi:hypothetical protein
MKNLSNYFYDAINDSINALDNKQDIIDYYGDPSECTIRNYFAAQIANGKLYDHTQEFSEETYLCDVEEYSDVFEDQRSEAYSDWLNSQEEEE